MKNSSPKSVKKQSAHGRVQCGFVALKQFFFCAAAALSALAASADTLSWRGKGDTNRFSEPMNWSSDGTHAIPQNGDTISFAGITTGISITNDIENLRLASIVDNLNYAVWINGKLEAGAVNSPGSAFLRSPATAVIHSTRTATR